MVLQCYLQVGIAQVTLPRAMAQRVVGLWSDHYIAFWITARSCYNV